MTERDPIVSPTLALLYLAQGHLGRARAIVEQILERDPTDGHALVLARRLTARGNSRISCDLRGDQLDVRWQGVEPGEDTHVLWVFTGGDRRTVRTRVSSTRCHHSFGSLQRPVPWPRGSVTCCVARVDAGGGLVPVAVGPVCTWG